jgi:hypothetical protein
VAKVRVPKTPRKALDRARRPSTLLLGQIEHLEWAVLPASQRKPDQLPTRKVKSEAQAAERVAQLTKMLHESHAAAPSRAAAADAKAAPRAAAPGDAPAAVVRAPVVLPPLPKAAARRKRRPAMRRPATRARKTTRSARSRRSRG